MTKGLIFDIKRYSIHDGPGIRTTVFFKGCPLSCLWCHNPESQAPKAEPLYRESRCIRCGACVDACPKGAISLDGMRPVVDRGRCEVCGACADACCAEAREIVGREMTVEQVMAQVERDLPFYEESGGGVTLSGGEPLVQEEFALELLEACRERGIHTAMDTCGYAPRETVERIRPYVDLFLYDLKIVDAARHGELTGAGNEPILKNLELLSYHGHRIIIVVPVIPGVNDDAESLRRMGELAAGLPHLDGVALLPFHRLGMDKYDLLGRARRLPGVEPPPPERLSEVARVLLERGLRVTVGG